MDVVLGIDVTIEKAPFDFVCSVTVDKVILKWAFIANAFPLHTSSYYSCTGVHVYVLLCASLFIF